MEQQLKRKSSTRKDYPTSSTQRKDYKREGSLSKPKYKGFKERKKEKLQVKEPSRNNRSRGTKFYRCGEKGHYAYECHNRRSTYILEHESESEGSSCSESETSTFEEEETLPCVGDLLMVIRLLENKHVELEQSQRENLFHTRCKVLEKTGSMIVDSGS